ncbi:MAG: AmmeMemoRadiSam system protein B [Candidatus Marinimicrobia bacterium]|nr:AmmeMemoRadiSam system protein B [Candidatus Neomarinimicrobiota bacterium]
MKTIKILLQLIILFCLTFNSCSKAQDRPPAVAGMFYPEDPKQLSSVCNQYLDSAGEKSLNVKPIGIIVPHAGYVYSGQVAAYAFKELKNADYDAAIILGPSHIEYFPFASVYSGNSYSTPLGKIHIDKKIVSLCETEDKFVRLSSRGHRFKPFERGEHSLEVELPFLQTVLGNIPIVPIVIGTMDWNVIQALGERLGEIASKKNVILIASSDLSHFHSYSECKKIDNGLISRLKLLNPKSFYNGLASKDFEACGGAPITAMMIAAKKAGANSIKVLKYANSGDIAYGDKSRVVGYLSAVLYNEKNIKSEEKEMKSKPLFEGELNKGEQLYLIELAEQTVRAVVINQPPPKPKNILDKFKEKRGAFVTLEKHDQLRGCIGYILPVYPLYETVIEVATSAALKDPRFPPVSESELDDITVEVSVLTVPKVITDPKVIEVGKHGIIIKRGFYQGLLLPQVATEYGWDRETFLEHTCNKAGLPKDAWKDKDTEIKIFSAQVFNRKTLGVE